MKKNPQTAEDSAFAAVGLVAGFAIGALLIDSMVSAVILGIGLSIALGMASRMLHKK